MAGGVVNKIEIWEPRWRDRKVLIADWKIGEMNEVTILAKKADGTRYYPESFMLSGEVLKSYPVEMIKGKKMRAVGLDSLFLGDKL